jgi:RNA polymerase sigma-70 factor (ECF subfamily)
VLSDERRSTPRALETLPAHHRAMVVLRDIEGLSNEETAAALGETVATVKSRRPGSRRALREQLTRDHVGGRPC